MPDVCLNHTEQYRLESFIEQVSGQLAADVVHLQRTGEFALAEDRILLQSHLASIRKMLSAKGMLRPILAPPSSASREGREAVAAELQPREPFDNLVHLVESGAA